ncbi:MAG: group II intron reverse transcriptase domain-containing protein [Candidatus Kerfeldbacteria bacterium]|nr:group II intron reverse transcriptase domain-containing protein [Candidatus Kerfeldbacteria bacterium]
MKVFNNIYERIISVENLFAAWEAFHSDKGNKPDVLEYEVNLEPNLFQLHRDLRSRKYRHGTYTSFYIHDPKQRHIHKASVRDRILHHAMFSALNPIFEPTFIPNSFSCRINKGTHKGVEAVTRMARQVSRNDTRPCFALKCDAQKFFFRIDQPILLTMLKRKLQDPDAHWLLEEIIGSFSDSKTEAKGLPIGNLTSQLFANVYMNEFDQFVKHVLKVKYYARYTDDFIILSNEKEYLETLIEPIHLFLSQTLALNLHPKKTSIRKLGQGIDFLGYTIFPHHQLVRTKTRQRIFKKLRQKAQAYKAEKITKERLEQSLQSYRGVLSHANSYKLREKLENQLWFWLHE